MRSVVLYQLLSLDGVAEEPGDWITDAGDELVDNLARVSDVQTDILLGHGTYDYWVDHWPSSDFEPFASFVNTTPKHVFSAGSLAGEWANTIRVSSPAAEYVSRLKEGDGGDIGIHGSIELSQSLWREGMIDVLELVVAPTVAGQGRRLFEQGGPAHPLQLERESRSAAGTLFLTYR